MHPCITLQPCLIKISFSPNSSTTLKSLHSFFTYCMYFGGAPIFLRAIDMVPCFAMSCPFTKSTSTAHESVSYSRLDYRIIFNDNSAPECPILGVASNGMGCLSIMSSFCVLTFDTILTILDPVSIKLIQRQFFKSVRSPFFEKGSIFELPQSSCIYYGSYIYSLMSSYISRRLLENTQVCSWYCRLLS